MLKNKTAIYLFAVLVAVIAINVPSSSVYAKPIVPIDSSSGSGTSTPATGSGCITNDARCASCNDTSANAATNCIQCASPPDPLKPGEVYCADPAKSCSQDSCDLINKYVNPLISLLTALVGVVAVISVIYGAIMYVTSAGDPQKAAKARGHLVKTVVGILGYFFFYALLQFLIPGGILRK